MKVELVLLLITLAWIAIMLTYTIYEVHRLKACSVFDLGCVVEYATGMVLSIVLLLAVMVAVEAVALRDPPCKRLTWREW